MVRYLFVILFSVSVFSSCNKAPIPIEWSDETDSLMTWWYQEIDFPALNEMTFEEFDYLGIYRVHFLNTYEYNFVFFEVIFYSCDSAEVDLKLYGNTTYDPPKIDSTAECAKKIVLSRSESLDLYDMIVEIEECYEKQGSFSDNTNIKNFKFIGDDDFGVSPPVFEIMSYVEELKLLKYVGVYWIYGSICYDKNKSTIRSLYDYLLDIMTGKVLTITCDDLK